MAHFLSTEPLPADGASPTSAQASTATGIGAVLLGLSLDMGCTHLLMRFAMIVMAVG